MSKKYKEPFCEFYIKKYPEYLSSFLDTINSVLLPINAYEQKLRKNVPKEDQELFIAYLYIENLIKQILHHHYYESPSFRFDGEEFPFTHIGTAWSLPHPNVIYTTKEALSMEEWAELHHPSKNLDMIGTLRRIRETSTLSDDQKALINNHLHNVIGTMEIKVGSSDPHDSQKLISKKNKHILPKLHEHIAEEMEVAVDPDFGQPLSPYL